MLFVSVFVGITGVVFVFVLVGTTGPSETLTEPAETLTEPTYSPFTKVCVAPLFGSVT